MTQPPESVTPSKSVAKSIKSVRARRGWSARVLAERCAALGATSLNRTTIANIEAGSRRAFVTVDELLVLACALEVSPLALLLPPESEPYEVAPERVAESVIRLYDWFLGRGGLPFGEQEPSLSADGIPAGLPDWLVARERQRIAERDYELNALRTQMSELAMTVVRTRRLTEERVRQEYEVHQDSTADDERDPHRKPLSDDPAEAAKQLARERADQGRVEAELKNPSGKSLREVLNGGEKADDGEGTDS